MNVIIITIVMVIKIRRKWAVITNKYILWSAVIFFNQSCKLVTKVCLIEPIPSED